MKKFLVQLEDRGFSFSVDIEAETIEEAVRIAGEKHCEPRQVTVTPRPTWVEPYPDDMEEGEEIYELTHEVQGACDECKLPFLSNHKPDPSWPWTNASGDDRGYTNICYGCAQRRKGTGNHCPLFDNFFRGPNCEGCPPDDCPKARDRHFQALRTLLLDVFKQRFVNVPKPDEVREFILNNEFGLAYEALKLAVGETSFPASSSEEHTSDLMVKVQGLMERGWK